MEIPPGDITVTYLAARPCGPAGHKQDIRFARCRLSPANAKIPSGGTPCSARRSAHNGHPSARSALARLPVRSAPVSPALASAYAHPPRHIGCRHPGRPCARNPTESGIISGSVSEESLECRPSRPRPAGGTASAHRRCESHSGQRLGECPDKRALGGTTPSPALSLRARLVREP